jgi:hypothetical protein
MGLIPDLEEDLLQHLLRGLRVPEDPAGEGEEKGGVAIVQLPQSSVITG